MSPVFHREGRFTAPRRRLDSGMMAGAVIVVLGVLLTLDNLAILDIATAWRFWPLILVALGAGRIAEGGRRRRFFGLLLVSMGAALQLQQLDMVALEWSDLRRWWPLSLVCLGIYWTFYSRWRGRIGPGLALLLAGGWFQLEELKLVSYPIARLWPLALVALGLAVMLGRRRSRVLH